MIVFLLLILLIPIIVLWIFWFVALHKFNSLDKIPGPKPIPFLGNSLQCGNTPQGILKNLTSMSKEYGGIFKLLIGNELKVTITDPELLETILTSNEYITKSNTYDNLTDWLGVGLLISTGKKWKSRRKLITPAFHFKILDSFVDVFSASADNLIKKLSKETEKSTCDMFPYINFCSLDIICETAMGIKLNEDAERDRRYIDAVREILEINMIRSFSAWKRYKTLYQLSPEYKKYTRYINTLHNFTNSVITLRRKEFSKKDKSQVSHNDVGIKRKIALLDLLLESESNNLLSNEDIREEIDTFMFEGHDTTSSGTAFSILALADHQEIQDKVFEEIMSVFGEDRNIEISISKLQEMKYLDMVLREVQRFYTTVPLIERWLHKDWTIGGYKFSKGTVLSLLLYGMRHLKTVYPDPDVFDPERFSPENQAQRHKYAHVPFSAGPRNCIGQRFALLEMKTILAKLLRNYRLRAVPGFKPDLGTVGILKSFNGIQVQLSNRKK